MSSVAEPTPSPESFDKRWVWGVRIAALVCIFLPWLLFIRSLINPCNDESMLWGENSVLCTLTYLIILFSVGFRGEPKKIRLEQAAQAGLFLSLAAIFMATVGPEAPGGLMRVVFGLSNITFMMSAIKTYSLMEQEPHVLRFLLKKWRWNRLVFGLLYLLGAFLASGVIQLNQENFEKSHGLVRQASAVGELRDINTVEGEYSSKYHQGFSANLRALGPSLGSAQPDASAAGLIDSSLASGTKGGYTFNYFPGPRDSNGRITSYSISARCGCTGGRNFYMDESGVIRSTSENRPANAKDPPLFGLSPPSTPSGNTGDQAMAAMEKAIQLDPKRVEYYKALEDLLLKRSA